MNGGLVMSTKENFLFMASWIDLIKGYDASGKPEIASELSKQMLYYGVTGEMTSEDPVITGTVTAMCSAVIDKSKKRYNNYIENGKSGGRPKQYNDETIISLYESGLSEQDIADNLGCHIRTVKRALAATEDIEI